LATYLDQICAHLQASALQKRTKLQSLFHLYGYTEISIVRTSTCKSAAGFKTVTLHNVMIKPENITRLKTAVH
jgi:hypothetical protein